MQIWLVPLPDNSRGKGRGMGRGRERGRGRGRGRTRGRVIYGATQYTARVADARFRASNILLVCSNGIA